MAAPRFPSDVRLLDWAGREDFGRVRAEWLELIRRDVALLAADKLVLAEIGARLGFDRNHAWPSIPRLAADLGLSDPTVKRAIARAIERGYLTCEKRGFGGSNHYAMSASRIIANEVVEAHEKRIAKFNDTRRQSMRSPMIPMVDSCSNEITDDPSMRSPMIPHSDHPRSLNEITGDPLTLSSNPINEPDHRTLSQGLSEETVQDGALGAQPVDFGDVYRVLGGGDEVIGASRVVRLGSDRWAQLRQQIEEHGVGGAWEHIQCAIALAITLESTSKSEVSP